MSFRNVAESDDEDFGFHYKRFIPVAPPSSAHTTHHVIDEDTDSFDMPISSQMRHKKINDEYDRKPATTQISKGKAVAFEHRQQWRAPEYTTNTLALSPISPYTPYTPPGNQQHQQSDQQILSQSYVSIGTLSPELTGPQTAISPSRPTATIPNGKDTISDDSSMVKVKAPPSTLPTSEYFTMIKSDLPQLERKRQLLLMLLQQDLEKQCTRRDISGNDDETDLQVTRQNNVQWVFQQVIEKLSNREVNPLGNQPVNESVFAYPKPNSANDRRRMKMKNYKQLYSELEKESNDRKQTTYLVYKYNAKAEDLRDTYKVGETINLGSCHDYLDLMDDDQQAFIKDYQQWKDESNQRVLENGDDSNGDNIAIPSASTSIPSLRELMIRKSKLVTELRQQLNIANERQKQAGELGGQILADLAAKLKQETLCFPSIDKPAVAIDHHTDQPPLSSSSSSSSSLSPQLLQPSSSSHIDTTDIANKVERLKKRRFMGLGDDIEKYGKPNFEFFQTMSKLK